MKWEELPLADRAQLMAAAVRNGYTDIRSIKAAYANFQNQRQQTGNRFDEGGDVDNNDVEVVNVLDEHPVWKALKNIDYETVADPEFTREKTGQGSIEYFSAEEPEGITYTNGYHRDHPMPGKDVILYNPDENDEQDIRLDALHIMPKDPTYDALNTIYRNASWDARDDNYINAKDRYTTDKVKQAVRYVIDKVTGKNTSDRYYGTDPFMQYFNNEADATLRSLLMEGNENYRTSKRYWGNKDEVREWNAHLMPYVNDIQRYLETGERPPHVLPNLEVTNQNAYGGNLFKTGGNKSKKRGITQQELQRRRDYYRQQLIIRGLRGAQLDAVLANMEVESTFDPGAHNDASGARGLMQWLGSRKPKSWSEKDQLDYIAATYNRFGGNEWLDKKAWKRFNETTDPAEAARLFRRYWERPERSSWNATDKLFKNSKGSYLPQDVNDLVAQVSNLQYNEPKAPVFTEEDQRLLDTPALAFYNPEYEDTQAPDYKPSALQESIKLDENLWHNPANGWALYNQFANMQQGSSQDDPLGWMTMMASLSPKTTPEQKEAASTMYQLFAPQDGDYSYHGLNFAAYGGKVNRFNDGGFSDLPEQRAYRRAVNLKAPYTNYEDAIDMDDSIMLRLKKFFDKGVSNCTLTASQLFNPNNPIGRARTIVNDSINNGFYEIDADHVVPGTMVIASHPNMSDYSPEQNYHTMIVTGFAPNDYEYTFRDGTKYQIKKGEPLVSYSRGKASADNYVHNIPLSVYNAKSEGKTYNRYYRPIDERYPQVMIDGIEVVANKKANGGHLFDNGGNLFYKGGLEDQFANTYLGIGQFPDYDSDFIATNNLQYLPYSQLNMMGHDPENIRIGNHGNQTMYTYDDKNATYLADANGNLVTSPLLRQMTQDYVKEHYGPMLQKAFLSNPDKYWDEYNRYRNSAIIFDENGNPVSSGLPPIEKPIEPAAPEFWLLSAGASKAPSALNSVISPLFNMTAVDNMIDDVTPYSSWGNMMSQNAGGPEWAWDLVHPSFTGGLFTNAAKKALTAGADAASKATRNAVASAAINYGAKTRTLPTNIYKLRRAFKGPDNKFVWDSDPFVEFINAKRDIPENTSFFFRMPNNANILNARNGAYRAKGSYYGPIISGGTVDGKFVSYGEPWMEFGTGPNSSWYEFPTSMNRGGRGPYRMATDWRGNRMDYDVTEAWRSMMLTQNPEFVAEEKAIDEALSSQKFNSTRERIQAYKEARTPFYEKWEYNPDIRTDIYAGNQTVIPNKEWHFDNRGFLSQPFWRYTADPYSGAVQKELMMNWPSSSIQSVSNKDILPISNNSLVDRLSEQWDWNRDLALFRGDTQKLQRLRDLHFKSAAPNNKYIKSSGMPEEGTHGTNNNFYSFELEGPGIKHEDPGDYGYGHYFYPGNTTSTYGDRQIHAYLNMERPYTGEWNRGFNRGQAGLSQTLKNMRSAREFGLTNLTPEEMIEELNKLKISDGVLAMSPYSGRIQEIVIPTGNQIKLVNPLTFDNNGNLIPLSSRDNFNINDMRFSTGGIIHLK